MSTVPNNTRPETTSLQTVSRETFRAAVSVLIKRRVPALCMAIVTFYCIVGLLTFLPVFDRAASRVLPPLPAASPDSLPITEYHPPSAAHFPDFLLAPTSKTAPSSFASSTAAEPHSSSRSARPPCPWASGSLLGPAGTLAAGWMTPLTGSSPRFPRFPGSFSYFRSASSSEAPTSTSSASSAMNPTARPASSQSPTSPSSSSPWD